jgi:hypothetical protein
VGIRVDDGTLRNSRYRETLPVVTADDGRAVTAGQHHTDRPAATAAQKATGRAAGIYGLIVAASVLATVGGQMRTAPLAVAVFVTLLVYWLSEQYADLGARASEGRMPTVGSARAALRAKWPIVSASYIPLVALLVARLLGATASDAALVAMIVIMGLLMIYGWRAGRSARMGWLGQTGMVLLAGALGALMILLKVSLKYLH